MSLTLLKNGSHCNESLFAVILGTSLLRNSSEQKSLIAIAKSSTFDLAGFVEPSLIINYCDFSNTLLLLLPLFDFIKR